MTGQGGLGRKFIGSAGWVFAETWSTKAVSLLVFVLLARVLGPEDFGLVSLAAALVAIMQVFANSGFSKALIQKRRLEDADASTAFWTSIALALAVYAALIPLAGPISDAIGAPQLAPILIALGVVVPLTALSRIPAALLSRDFRFRQLSIRTVGATLAGALVAIPLALGGFGAWALVGQAIAESVAAVVVLWTATSWRPRLQFSLASLRSLWATGVSLMGIELLDAIQSQIDKLVVGVLFSTTELGIYSLAQRLGLILQELITSVISKVSLTTFSRAQDDLQRVARIFRQLTFATALISFPVFAIVAALSQQIIPFLFGSEWVDAVPLVWIMAGGWAFASIAMFDRGALVGTGHAPAALSLALVQNAISIALVFIFAPLGVFGIAFSRFARILTWPIRLVMLKRYISLPIGKYVWQVLKCVLAALPAVVGIVLLQATSWASVDFSFWLFAVPVGTLAFLVTIPLTMAIADRESRAAVNNQLRSVIKFRKRRKSG